MNTPRILGISDDITECECCGRKNLKRTVALDFDGDVRHYGSDCAAKALMPKPKRGDVEALTAKARAITLAESWLAAGHPATVVARGIWNKFGFLTDVKGGEILIGTFGRVRISEGS